ncbi:sensor histidine kinase [Nonomuraea terrae]|uniref:Sensor histidine kinase n=1 Tax=Nonomuraea terrae TaxID=2530383 RepID=A0A4R4YK54_9ACTN|nr:histidine kinase [Nonomuraea terrae]TDD44504.1 sensor histidine kinase [Nonomuraea terrae]
MESLKRARRLTWMMLAAVFALMWLLIAVACLAAFAGDRLSWWSVGPALAAAAGLTWVGLRLITRVMDRRYPTRQVVLAAVLAVVAAGVGGAEPTGWGYALVAWLSIATLHVPKRIAVLISAGTGVVAIGLAMLSLATGRSGMDADMGVGEGLVTYTLIYALWCALMPPTTRLWVWIWWLAEEAHAGREAHTRLAVAEERLRFARDLHDLVGHQLSAIAVKTELATRLSDVDAGRAKAEMAEVNALTRKALRELREAIRGYRELDLAAELNSVKGVLEAAGVRCEVRLPYRELPDGVAPVFAYAVREAVTNVLKHSTATYCDITIRFTEHEAELSVRNDGVVRRTALDLGSGLAGMRERLDAVGGRVTAQPASDGEFLLTAVVSLPLAG